MALSNAERQRLYIRRLKERAVTNGSGDRPVSNDAAHITELEAERETLRAEIAELKAKLTEQVKPAPVTDAEVRDPTAAELEITKLKRLLRTTRARLRSAANQLDQLRYEPKAAYIDSSARRKILMVLHPDRTQDPEEKKRLEEAFRLFKNLRLKEIDLSQPEER